MFKLPNDKYWLFNKKYSEFITLYIDNLISII